MRLIQSYSLLAAIAWFVVAGWQLASDETRAGVVAGIAGVSFVVALLLQERSRHRETERVRQVLEDER